MKVEKRMIRKAKERDDYLSKNTLNVFLMGYPSFLSLVVSNIPAQRSCFNTSWPDIDRKIDRKKEINR